MTVWSPASIIFCGPLLMADAMFNSLHSTCFF